MSRWKMDRVQRCETIEANEDKSIGQQKRELTVLAMAWSLHLISTCLPLRGVFCCIALGPEGGCLSWPVRGLVWPLAVGLVLLLDAFVLPLSKLRGPVGGAAPMRLMRGMEEVDEGEEEDGDGLEDEERSVGGG